MTAWLVVGLGNPGERYAATRHNVGARVVDVLAARRGDRFRKARFIPADLAETRIVGERVYLFRPRAFMNESGPPVASFARRHGLPPDRIVACHDEIDIPLGALRLKLGGSTAGHNGLRSLVRALGGDEGFYRVRVGVGRPPGRKDPAAYVLEPFAKRERADAELLVERAADAVETLLGEGLAAAQDRFNRSPG